MLIAIEFGVRTDGTLQNPPRKADIATYFIAEFEDLVKSVSIEKRRQLLSGSSLSVVVAGRYVLPDPK
jgi:hypothetical protein